MFRLIAATLATILMGAQANANWTQPTADSEQQPVEVVSDDQGVDLELFIVDEEDTQNLGVRLEELSADEMFGEGGLVDGLRSYEEIAAAKGSLPMKKPRALKRSCVVQSGGQASWYGPGFHGKKTANGEKFNQMAYTAASKTIKFNSLVRVTYKGKSVTVRINDAGPYHGDRIMDLAKGAATAIGMKGVGLVKLELVRCGK